jgi:hypothetical protein
LPNAGRLTPRATGGRASQPGNPAWRSGLATVLRPGEHHRVTPAPKACLAKATRSTAFAENRSLSVNGRQRLHGSYCEEAHVPRCETKIENRRITQNHETAKPSRVTAIPSHLATILSHQGAISSNLASNACMITTALNRKQPGENHLGLKTSHIYAPPCLPSFRRVQC